MSKSKGNFMEEKFLPVAAKIAAQRHLLALRDGIIMIMPLLILGSFTMIIAEFPIPAYLDFMARVFGENWTAFSNIIVGATFGIVTLVACFGVTSSLVKSYDLDGTPAGMIALAAFFVVNVQTGEGAWDAGIFDASHLFIGLIIALITGEIYRLLVQKGFTIKLPKNVPPAVSRQFTALLPGMVILVVFVIVHLLFALANTTFPEFIVNAISTPFRNVGTSYGGTLAAVFVEHFLWSLGLHGSSIIIFPIFEPMWIMNMTENMTMAAKHIVTFTFYENGVWMGGSGATLPVVVYMLVFAKSKLLKQIGKISIAPGLFNINEPVTFGLPIVLNPFLMIPFFIAPAAVMTLQYVGTAIGLFPYCNIMVPWTTPFLISGFLTTGSIMGVVAQLLSFALAFVIWLPFIRIWDNRNYLEEQAAA